MDTLGVDIGTTTVKYVRYRKKANRIVSQGEYRYRRGWEELRDILTAVKEKEGTNLGVALGITSVDLLKKTYSVPVMPEQAMKAEVDALVSRGMLVPLLDMHREYLLLGEVEERGAVKQDVLFLGAHKSLIDHVAGLFYKAGFKRLLTLTDVGFCYQPMTDCALDGAVAVVDIGGRQTGVYIMDNGRLLLTREIMTACEALKDAIVGGTGLSPNEAEDYLWTNGFFEASADALTLPFERLAAQVQRTFLVYSQKYPKRQVVKAWVTGRGATIPGLPEKLTELLGYNINVLPSRAEIDQQYIPAYALATRADRFPNLLTDEMTASKWQTTLPRYARTAGIIIIAGIGLFSLAAQARLHFLKTTIDGRLAMLSQKYEQPAAANPGRQSRPPIRTQPSLKEMGQKETSFVLLLKVLSSHLPSQVYLKSVEFAAPPAAFNEEGAGRMPPKGRRGATMHLHGYVVATDEEVRPVLMQVLVSLEKSGFLRNVRVDEKGMKTVDGRMLMEFVASAECRGHEI
ncbi:MAG TPA: hypothetical protein DCR97_10445 [Deltaproteobacteria bacterium]|nr:hypothetical protein [Deltaproteobacteria bacterium]